PTLRTLAHGRATLLISHDLSLAALADTVITLDHGILAATATAVVSA
ncbi:MAG: hypothetical protein QOC83_6304, partial [Pseudonocardiales bacterium]|nr:hypothetical protein [Pseudonocardiales bacterium]